MTNTSIKEKFSKEEWFKVLTGIGQAGTAVIVSSPSGVTGLIAEMGAIVKGLREEIAKEPRTPLQEAIAAELMAGPPKPEDLPQDSEGRVKDPAEAKKRSLEAVRQALWLVDSKLGTEEGQAYRTMLRTVSERVAHAAKEGGFLGFGGEQVSAEEKSALAELEQLMGAPSSAPAAQS